MNTETYDEITKYSAERRNLLRQSDALPRAGNVIEWQRQLADAIMRAERDSADRTRTNADRLEAKRHRHLLRVVGDGLVHTLIPSHTIRTLSRHPGKPAHLTSQGEDFEFVLETAQTLASLGAIPIVSDLTTLIGLGDIVIIVPDGVSVIECKNSQAPARPPTGRIARQQQRGVNAADYLANSWVEEDGGYRVAFENPLPQPDYELVERLLHECIQHPQGIAVHAFSEDDLIIAATENADTDLVMAELAKVMDPSETAESRTLVGISFLDDLVETATYRRVAPPNYPIAPQLRWQLLERELHLIRIVNMEALAAEIALDDGRTLTLTPRRGEHGIEVLIEGTEADHLNFSHEIAEFCVWTPTPIDALRESLIAQAKQIPAHLTALAADDLPAISAYGDSITYRTLYRPSTDSAPGGGTANRANKGSDTGAHIGPGAATVDQNDA